MWDFDWFLFEVGKEKLESAFWIGFDCLETTYSISRGHFRWIFRDSDSSNLTWNNFQYIGLDEKNWLEIEAILATKVNKTGEWSLDRWFRFFICLFISFGIRVMNKSRISGYLFAGEGL